MPDGVNGESDLLEVLGAMGAVAEMGLEAAPLASGEDIVEVVGDQGHRLPADEIPIQDAHGHLPSISSSMVLRRWLRPRWSRTLWFASLIPRTSQTSWADSLSTSRSVTTWHWAGGRSSMAIRSLLATAEANRRSTTSSVHSVGGRLH